MNEADALRGERLQLVAYLRSLEPDAWDRPSLCSGWTVRHVLAHLVTPFTVSAAALMLTAARAGGMAAAMDRTARRTAERPTPDLINLLEHHADSTWRPPGLPLTAPLTEAVIHGADIRWALHTNRTDWDSPQRLLPILGFLTSWRAVAGFVPPKRLRGLRLISTDLDWSHGAGHEVRGPSLALAAGILGRPAARTELVGAGLPYLFDD